MRDQVDDVGALDVNPVDEGVQGNRVSAGKINGGDVAQRNSCPRQFTGYVDVGEVVIGQVVG